MSGKYPSWLCLPQNPGDSWLNYIRHNFYVNKDGQVFKHGKTKPIGSKSSKGYLTVCFTHKVLGKKNFKVHHLAWYLHPSKNYQWPLFELDHFDNCRSNNRIDNLKEISREGNLAKRNLRRKNETIRTNQTSRFAIGCNRSDGA